MFTLIYRAVWPWVGSALLYGMTALPGMAEPVTAAMDVGVEAPSLGAAVSTSTNATSIFGAPVAADDLAQARGGTFHVENNMKLTGTTSNNSAQNVVTGSNSVDGGSFSHMNGFPVVVQNSGANVLIQNAVIVNLQMQ